VVASDKLFYWLFQQRAERLQPLVASLLPQMGGYVFSAPVLKEREYRLDGLFLPPAPNPGTSGRCQAAAARSSRLLIPA
jgi:predicted transposase YdaD